MGLFEREKFVGTDIDIGEGFILRATNDHWMLGRNVKLSNDRSAFHIDATFISLSNALNFFAEHRCKISESESFCELSLALNRVLDEIKAIKKLLTS